MVCYIYILYSTELIKSREADSGVEHESLAKLKTFSEWKMLGNLGTT